MTESEIDKDWKAFAAIRKDKEVDNMGHTALRHDGQLIAIYNDCGDAYTIGVEKFGLGHFPIKTFGERPKSLGAFTPPLQPEDLTAALRNRIWNALEMAYFEGIDFLTDH